MSEIKLKAELVQQKLTDLQQALNDIQSGNLDEGSGREMLDLQTKINAINGSLKSLMQDYQQMALQHTKASSDAVDSLEKAEQAMAKVMRAFKLG